MSTIESVKTEARVLHKQHPTMSHSQCLEVVSKQHGFKTYAALRAAVGHIEQLAKPGVPL